MPIPSRTKAAKGHESAAQADHEAATLLGGGDHSAVIDKSMMAHSYSF